MPKEYPKGAIRTINELIALAGKPVYEGSRQFKSVSRTHILTGGICGHVESNGYIYYGYELTYEDGHPSRFSSLLDMNVIENNYNDWFLFPNKDDAQAWANG